MYAIRSYYAYADLIYTDENQEKVLYFEPAVITAQSQKEADKTLALFAPWLEGQNNLIKNRPAERNNFV